MGYKEGTVFGLMFMTVVMMAAAAVVVVATMLKWHEGRCSLASLLLILLRRFSSSSPLKLQMAAFPLPRPQSSEAAKKRCKIAF